MLKITKKNNKSWVTFTYQPTHKVSSVILTGSWDDWNDNIMKEKKNGEFYITKVLPANAKYEFRYLVDNKEWINETDLPTMQNPHGSYNSLLEL